MPQSDDKWRVDGGQDGPQKVWPPSPRWGTWVFSWGDRHGEDSSWAWPMGLLTQHTPCESYCALSCVALVFFSSQFLTFHVASSHSDLGSNLRASSISLQQVTIRWACTPPHIMGLWVISDARLGLVIQLSPLAFHASPFCRMHFSAFFTSSSSCI